LIQGGELVTGRAREMVSGRFRSRLYTVLRVQPQPEKLRGSTFNTPEDIEAFSQKFDEGLKKVFFDDNGTQYIKFGSPRDNDPKHGIKMGKLTLTG
jgi:hypothetical protein